MLFRSGDKPYELLDNIEADKDYNIKINFKELTYETNKEGENVIGSGGSDRGDTYYTASYPLDISFETTINGANIIGDTKVYKIDKKVAIQAGEKSGTFNIEEVRVSPVSVKVKYTFESEDIGDLESDFEVTNQKGKILYGLGGTGYQEGNIATLREDYEIKGNEEKIILTPTIYDRTDKGNRKFKEIGRAHV